MKTIITILIFLSVSICYSKERHIQYSLLGMASDYSFEFLGETEGVDFENSFNISLKEVNPMLRNTPIDLLNNAGISLFDINNNLSDYVSIIKKYDRRNDGYKALVVILSPFIYYADYSYGKMKRQK